MYKNALVASFFFSKSQNPSVTEHIIMQDIRDLTTLIILISNIGIIIVDV